MAAQNFNPMFQQSDKVVCVGHRGIADAERSPCIPNEWCPDGQPTEGIVYVVEGTYIDARGRHGIGLVGIRVNHPEGLICAWDARCFRKLSEVQAENQLKRENEKVGDKREAWERQMDAILKRIQQL